MKKLYIYILILFILFSSIFTNISLADDMDELENSEEKIDVVEEASSVLGNDLPSINSRAYVVLDRKSNTVIFGKNEYQKRKMASTTKIMTSLLIIENCKLEETVEISKKSASTGGSRLGLKTGDKITVNDLLYGLMLRSGNDAAVALAEHCSGSVEEFAKLMNSKTKELELSNTNFVTPHGLDSDEHYTSAYELAVLSNYALENKMFKNIVGTKTHTININGYPRALSNTNELLGYLDGVYGIKTGFTNGANRCLVTACTRGDMDIICIVLGADTKSFRTQDSIKLIEYTFKNYKSVNLQNIVDKEFEDFKSENLTDFVINKGISNNISIKLGKLSNSVIPIKNDLVDKIDIDISYQSTFEAPVDRSTSVGTIYITSDNQVIDSCKINFDCEIEKKGITDYLYYLISSIGNFEKFNIY